MPWYEIETLDVLSALTEALRRPAENLAARLNDLVVVANDLRRAEQITVIETQRMAQAWDQVTKQLSNELVAVKRQIDNPTVLARIERANQALVNIDWYRDFSTTVGQEARMLGVLARNAGTVLSGLDVFIKVAIPDSTSFQVGSAAFAGLVGVAVGAAVLPFIAAAGAIGIVGVGVYIWGQTTDIIERRRLPIRTRHLAGQAFHLIP